MRFVAGGLNGLYLLDIANKSVKHTKTVFAASAYASSDPTLFRVCRDNDIRLKFWGRYDASVPIATAILRNFLDRRSPNYECKLVPDIFHPKVIWWKEYGVYIGSANLTEPGWFGNIEAGIFIDSYEIVENDLEDELNSFFEELEERSFPLTEELYNELFALERENSRLDASRKVHTDKFKKKRIIPPLDPLTRIVKRSGTDRKRTAFIIEWNDTLQLLRNISERVSTDQYRPIWVKNSVPKGVQVDQFLHAYYYAEVRKGTRALHHEFHEKNSIDPEKALIEAMDRWRSLEQPPHLEDRTIYEWASYLREKLDNNNILDLTKSDFIGVCTRVHAMRDHSLRVKYSEYGLEDPLPTMNIDQRIEYYANWLFDQKSKSGNSVLETINFVLHGGDPDKLSDRLWEAVTNQVWFIRHLGVSSLGEMVGWAMPDIFPPRNGRTSKALYALGNKVRIHSE